ncbi:hypothetical protein BASA81_006578 [Batrachochytrium salamandrivorans]|nr:hypothetical protein BASA81_006578 [Batrachochytrium salamandrivorans]
MGDVRDILQVPSLASSSAVPGRGGRKKPSSSSAAAAAKKPKNMSREVFNLQSAVGATARGGGGGEEEEDVGEEPSGLGALRKFKIDPTFRARRWHWAKFQNSAREGEDKSPVSHWSRGDASVEDYPFCRFNKPSYAVRFTSEEYNQLVESVAGWTKNLDFELLELCKRYDCRWPVVADRLAMVAKTANECKHRYFALAKLAVSQQVKNFYPDEERDSKLTFDCRAAILALKSPSTEHTMVEQELGVLNRLFFQSKADQCREQELLVEMKLVEDEIKKLKVDKKKLDESVSKGKRNKQNKAAAAIAPYKPEDDEATVADLPRLLLSSDQTNSSCCWKRSSDFGQPLFTISASQQKHLTSLCNVKPVVATHQVLSAYKQYREDSLRLVLYQHAIKRIKSDIKHL